MTAAKVRFSAFESSVPGHSSNLGEMFLPAALEKIRCILIRMSRAPFNVHVIPFRTLHGSYEYAVLKRSDGDIWQGIAGGGEDDEPVAARYEIRLSSEHTEYHWLPYEQAYNVLTFENTKNDLWELNQRLKGKGPRG